MTTLDPIALENHLVLPRGFVLEFLVPGAVPTLHEAALAHIRNPDARAAASAGLEEDYVFFAVDCGASAARSPEEALHRLLAAWQAGRRPGGETP